MALGWTVARLKNKILTERKNKNKNTTTYHLLCPCTSVLQWHFINVSIYLINMLRCDIYGLDVSLTCACWARLRVNFNVLSKHNGKYLKGCTIVIVNKSWCGHADMCLLSVDLYYKGPQITLILAKWKYCVSETV